MPPPYTTTLDLTYVWAVGGDWHTRTAACPQLRKPSSSTGSPPAGSRWRARARRAGQRGPPTCFLSSRPRSWTAWAPLGPLVTAPSWSILLET